MTKNNLEIQPGDLVQYDARQGGGRDNAKIALVLEVTNTNRGNGFRVYCPADKAKYHLMRAWITKKL